MFESIDKIIGKFSPKNRISILILLLITVSVISIVTTKIKSGGCDELIKQNSTHIDIENKYLEQNVMLARHNQELEDALEKIQSIVNNIHPDTIVSVSNTVKFETTHMSKKSMHMKKEVSMSSPDEVSSSSPNETSSSSSNEVSATSMPSTTTNWTSVCKKGNSTQMKFAIDSVLHACSIKKTTHNKIGYIVK